MCRRATRGVQGLEKKKEVMEGGFNGPSDVYRYRRGAPTFCKRAKVGELPTGAFPRVKVRRGF